MMISVCEYKTTASFWGKRGMTDNGGAVPTMNTNEGRNDLMFNYSSSGYM
jgi:hypothetical protein